ncbi:MAG: TolB protein [Mariprofundus sp.]
MKNISILFILLSALSPSAFANSFFDWVGEQKLASPLSDQAIAADRARLLTLESGETEMYPQLSPDGRFLITLSSKGKHQRVSRRYAENGDPANPVTDDNRAVDSAGWHDNEHIYYLSEKAGGLALWERGSDGEGMQRRILPLHGLLTQPLLLADQSVIAVRLKPIKSRASSEHKSRTRRGTQSNFNNFSFAGYRTQIVHFGSDNSEVVLSEGINPSLSPDGQWIAFSMATGRSIHLFRMHPDGSELIQITDSRSIDIQPSWSRDGQSILFTSNRADPDLRHTDRGQWDIWQVDINGRHLSQLTRDPGRDGGASMGLNGKVYFHSDRNVDHAIRAQHQSVSGSASGFHIWVIDSIAQTAPASVN